MDNKDFVLSLFKQYTIDNNNNKLIQNLKEFESKFQTVLECTDIWFRFFKNDPFAVDLYNIEYAFNSHNSHINHMNECISIAVHNPKHFELRFDTYNKLT